MTRSLHLLPSAIAAAAIAAFVAACSSDGCLENRSSIPLAAIYSSETDTKATVTGLRIHGIGAPGDSLLVDADHSFSELYLPMRSSMQSTSWCVAYAWEGFDSPEWNDTITFTYTSQPYFASEECGAMYNYMITKVEATAHVLDSVAVMDSLITNMDIVRIRLYYPVIQQ